MTTTEPPATSAQPDEQGHFGEFGGQYIPETLMPAVAELEIAYHHAMADQEFRTRLDGLLKDYVGRPTPLTCVERLSEQICAPVYLNP